MSPCPLLCTPPQPQPLQLSLARRLELVVHAQNDRIIQEGERQPYIYLIARGRLGVSEKEVLTASPELLHWVLSSACDRFAVERGLFFLFCRERGSSPEPWLEVFLKITKILLPDAWQVEVQGHVVSVLETGSYAGDMSALLGRSAACSFIAMTNCELYRIKAEELQQILDYCPGLRETMTQMAERRLDWLTGARAEVHTHALGHQSSLQPAKSNRVARPSEGLGPRPQLQLASGDFPSVKSAAVAGHMRPSISVRHQPQEPPSTPGWTSRISLRSPEGGRVDPHQDPPSLALAPGQQPHPALDHRRVTAALAAVRRVRERLGEAGRIRAAAGPASPSALLLGDLRHELTRLVRRSPQHVTMSPTT